MSEYRTKIANQVGVLVALSESSENDAIADAIDDVLQHLVQTEALLRYSAENLEDLWEFTAFRDSIEERVAEMRRLVD